MLKIDVCRDQVHRLMNPPVKTSIQAKQLKGLSDARVPPKRNESFKKVHPDFHYASSQISLVNQLGVLFDENTLSLSVDNKNKVEVGIPATSRRSKINKFYLKEFSPNYFDQRNALAEFRIFLLFGLVWWFFIQHIKKS